MIPVLADWLIFLYAFIAFCGKFQVIDTFSVETYLECTKSGNLFSNIDKKREIRYNDKYAMHRLYLTGAQMFFSGVRPRAAGGFCNKTVIQDKERLIS